MNDLGTREERVLIQIERARARAPHVKDELITMAHGSGGKATHTLVTDVFVERFANTRLARLEDQALIDVGGTRLAFTTDSFVVSPLFFPGGSIGDLAVNGTVNDLAVGGAQPLALAAAFVLEEGFPVDDLRRVTDDVARAARAARVDVVTGDTKVVERGKADGCYVATTGLGIVPQGVHLGTDEVRAGDTVIVSGPIGDHGATIMLCREDLGIEADIVSDTAPLNGVVRMLLERCDGVRWMRDATRGGVATVLNELADGAQVAVELDEDAVPVRAEVRGVSELLGIDPLYIACEGRMVCIVDPSQGDAALCALEDAGCQPAAVGRIKEGPAGMVMLRTGFGGSRIVDMLIGDPLPRIC
jgi:hydrogenase expression/formation protein HypE